MDLNKVIKPNMGCVETKNKSNSSEFEVVEEENYKYQPAPIRPNISSARVKTLSESESIIFSSQDELRRNLDRQMSMKK